jgi:hypothetical protein
MIQDVDDKFYARADEHIRLSNDQLKIIGPRKVSASMMYSLSRFNAWISARGFENAEQMAADRQSTLDFYLTEYRQMLEENLDDYIENFSKYRGLPDETS